MKVESGFDRAVEDREGERLAREAADQLVEVEVRTAKQLDRMTRQYAFVYAGASSIVHFAAMLGMPKKKAVRLSAAGKAFRLMPVIEEKVLDKELSLEAAAALAKILDHPVLSKEAWEWLGRAADSTPGQLAFAIRKAIAEEEAKTVVEPVTLMLPPLVRDKMGRVREILSGKLRTVLTNEQVVELSLDYYLDHEDPDRIREGTRRKGSTVNDPSRAIPRSVKRTVLARGRKCQVPRCGNHLFLSFCHIRWHAAGGSREPDNLWIGCFVHHGAVDHGRMTISGPAENPAFRNSRGEVIEDRHDPPGG